MKWPGCRLAILTELATFRGGFGSQSCWPAGLGGLSPAAAAAAAAAAATAVAAAAAAAAAVAAAQLARPSRRGAGLEMSFMPSSLPTCVQTGCVPTHKDIMKKK